MSAPTLSWRVQVPGVQGLCSRCGGGGSEWGPRRKDGGYDRRYRWPTGPCERCGGDGGWVTLDEPVRESA
jgi:hypothetical protein